MQEEKFLIPTYCTRCWQRVVWEFLKFHPHWPCPRPATHGHAHSYLPEEQLPSSVCCAVALADRPAMPRNALVILRYGPYSAAGLSVEHRTFRLEGLQGGQQGPWATQLRVPRYTLPSEHPCRLYGLPRRFSFLRPKCHLLWKTFSEASLPQNDLASSSGFHCFTVRVERNMSFESTGCQAVYMNYLDRKNYMPCFTHWEIEDEE